MVSPDNIAAALPEFPKQFLVAVDSDLRFYPTFSKIVSNDTAYDHPIDFEKAEPCKIKQNRPVLGEYFFPESRKKNLSKFERTALSLVVAHAVINETDQNYEFLTACQSPETRLSREGYHALSDSFFSFRMNPQARDVLDICLIIRGYARTPQARNRLEMITSRATSSMFPMETLKELLSYGLLPELANAIALPVYNWIRHAVRADFSLSQLLNGESPAILTEAFDEEDMSEAHTLTLAANLFEMVGNAGHIHQNGTAILNDRLVRDYLKLRELVTRRTPIATFLKDEVKSHTFDRGTSPEEAFAGVRLSRMMGLGSSKADRIADLLADAYPNYAGLTREMNIGFGQCLEERPVVFYYGLNYLSRTYQYFSAIKDQDPVKSTLKQVSPVLCGRIKTLRQEALKNPPRGKVLYLDLTYESVHANNALQRVH